MPVLHMSRGMERWLWIALALMLALGGGFIGRIRATVPAAESVEAAVEEDAIAAFRTEREQLREMQKAQLNDLIHDSGTEAEIAAMAQRQLLDLCGREEHEVTLEGLLALRGFENPVVTVQADSVNVLLKAQLVTQQECSVILDLVCRETGVQSGNVKIIPIN